MTPELLIQLLGFGGVAAGLYAAIRVDLVRAMVKAEHAMDMASRAHRRIDSLAGDRRHA
jgi:hypothetical protein